MPACSPASCFIAAVAPKVLVQQGTGACHIAHTVQELCCTYVWKPIGTPESPTLKDFIGIKLLVAAAGGSVSAGTQVCKGKLPGRFCSARISNVQPVRSTAALSTGQTLVDDVAGSQKLAALLQKHKS